MRMDTGLNNKETKERSFFREFRELTESFNAKTRRSKDAKGRAEKMP